MEIQKRLFELEDREYALFQSRLTPTVPLERFIGVRVPQARKLAKAYCKEKESELFLRSLPHFYYDENILHSILISEMRDYQDCIRETERFLSYVDNWAVCDILSPKVFKKNREALIVKVREWMEAREVYTCRFGLGMLMQHYLEESFKPEYLDWAASVLSEEYYVNMMLAWFFATALHKQWERTEPVLRNQRLGAWVHNKTIQKACESRRISEESKKQLRRLRIERESKKEGGGGRKEGS